MFNNQFQGHGSSNGALSPNQEGDQVGDRVFNGKDMPLAPLQKMSHLTVAQSGTLTQPSL